MTSDSDSERMPKVEADKATTDRTDAFYMQNYFADDPPATQLLGRDESSN